MVYELLGQICKDTDLYTYAKQSSPSKMVEGHSILARLLGQNHTNSTASKAEAALQILT